MYSLVYSVIIVLFLSTKVHISSPIQDTFRTLLLPKNTEVIFILSGLSYNLILFFQSQYKNVHHTRYTVKAINCLCNTKPVTLIFDMQTELYIFC